MKTILTTVFLLAAISHAIWLLAHSFKQSVSIALRKVPIESVKMPTNFGTLLQEELVSADPATNTPAIYVVDILKALREYSGRLRLLGIIPGVIWGLIALVYLLQDIVKFSVNVDQVCTFAAVFAVALQFVHFFLSIRLRAWNILDRAGVEVEGLNRLKDIFGWLPKA